MDDKMPRDLAKRVLTYLGREDLTCSTDKYATRIHVKWEDSITSQLLAISKLSDGRVMISSFGNLTDKVEGFLIELDVKYNALDGDPVNFMIPASEKAKIHVDRLPAEPAKQPTFDLKERASSGANRGICLDLVDSGKYQLEPAMVDYLKKVDSHERKTRFFPLEKAKAVFSRMDISVTQVQNAALVAAVYKTPAEDLKPESRILKGILDKCVEAYLATGEGSIGGVEKIYSILSSYFKTGNREGEGCFLLENLVNGQEGVCRDIAPAFDAVFRFFHIDSQLVFGDVGDNDERGAHVWLRVKAEGKEFELDPTWYIHFAPLEIRCYDAGTSETKNAVMTFQKKGCERIGK